MVSYAYEQAAAKRERVIEKQIKRYAKGYQRRLRKLVKTSSRLGDLLYSFPAAAFAVVSGYGDHNRRGEAVGLVKDGADLRTVAKALELPTWTRRLPPEAFSEPLGNLPDSEAFNRKIANFIPKDPVATAMWLNWLQAARAGCHEDFALWLARQDIYSSDLPPGVVGLGGAPILPLATFAWFSGHEDEPARRLMERPWRRNMRIGTAVDYMIGWFDRLLLDLTRAEQRRGPGRYSKRKGGANRYNLVPLVTSRELIEEGEAMDHCVATYASAVAQGQCRIYSVRRGGRRIATLELRWPNHRRDQPVINQLLGPSNVCVDRDVYLAVRDWLTHNQHLLGAPTVAGLQDQLDETRWRSFWQTYIAEKGDRAAVKVRPDGYLVARMCRDVDTLARCVRA
ncbi:MAG: PcfJ domain-containing protein [Hyphomicrobiaceae bacterium]